jgi:hypothetical protein
MHAGGPTGNEMNRMRGRMKNRKPNSLDVHKVAWDFLIPGRMSSCLS